MNIHIVGDQDIEGQFLDGRRQFVSQEIRVEFGRAPVLHGHQDSGQFRLECLQTSGLDNGTHRLLMQFQRNFGIANDSGKGRFFFLQVFFHVLDKGGDERLKVLDKRLGVGCSIHELGGNIFEFGEFRHEIAMIFGNLIFGDSGAIVLQHGQVNLFFVVVVYKT